jgi:hypothetical protein
MNNSGDAAEQIMRLSLDGAEFVLKIAGAGAKNLAVLLYSILNGQKRTKGRARLVTMLKSGKELKVFSVKESDLKMFSQEAKQYGILYCGIRDTKGSPDGMVDVMVRAEDAPKINRIVERFKFATVDTATVQADIEKARASKTPEAPEKTTPDKSAEDKLIDELFEKPLQKEQAQPENPKVAKMEKSPPSEPISKQQGTSEKGTTDGRRSVREDLKEIRSTQQQKADTPKRTEPKRDNKSKSVNTTRHKQPQLKPKTPKKSKER